MGHKTVVIFNNDHLARLERDPAEFVCRLTASILEHRRRKDVGHDGAVVATVVWSGHSREIPVLRIKDFDAEIAQEDELQAYEAARLKRLATGAHLP